MKVGHVGGTECATCAEHQTFKRASERRKENGIRLKRFCVLADENQVVSLNEYWSGWIEAVGKQRAVDYLLVCMGRADQALRDAMAKKGKK